MTYKVPQTPKRVALYDSTGNAIGVAGNPLEVTGAASDNYDPLLGKTGVSKTVDFTASQTAQTVWTPATGKKFVITDLVISFSAAGALTLFDGDTDSTTYRVEKWNGAANGGSVHPYRKPRVSVAANNSLKYTTGSGAAGSLTVWGYEE